MIKVIIKSGHGGGPRRPRYRKISLSGGSYSFIGLTSSTRLSKACRKGVVVEAVEDVWRAMSALMKERAARTFNTDHSCYQADHLILIPMCSATPVRAYIGSGKRTLKARVSCTCLRARGISFEGRWKGR